VTEAREPVGGVRSGEYLSGFLGGCLRCSRGGEAATEASYPTQNRKAEVQTRQQAPCAGEGMTASRGAPAGSQGEGKHGRRSGGTCSARRRNGLLVGLEGHRRHQGACWRGWERRVLIGSFGGLSSVWPRWRGRGRSKLSHPKP
jgi:hypothetical protein